MLFHLQNGGPGPSLQERLWAPETNMWGAHTQVASTGLASSKARAHPPWGQSHDPLIKFHPGRQL